MKSWIIKIIPLGALCAVAVGPVVAQSDDEEKEQRKREVAQKQVEKAQERVQEALEKVQGELGDRLSQAQDHLKLHLAKAQTVVALAQAGAYPAAVAPPAAPNAPEWPDVDVANNFRFDGGEFNWFHPGQASSQPLVISVSDSSPQKLAETQEDLNVMGRILKKAIERSGGHDKQEALGIVISSLPGGRRSDSFYLEGYGALFMLNVRYPLVPPPAVEETKTEKAPDTTWEKTKRELYGPREPRAGADWIFGNAKMAGEPPMKYDADRVDSLKEELTAMMKNAANLRHVKPDEYVAIAVVGGAGSAGKVNVERGVKAAKGKKRPVRIETPDDTDDDPKPADRVDVFAVAAPNGAGQRQTNLILRARKSDIDAFAKGDLDLEAFRKKASVRVY